MKIILLSGDSGNRLWPLSNGARSKQFLKLLKSPDKSFESMLQRTCRQIKEAVKDADITVSVPRSQVPAVHNQLGESFPICDMICKKDTFEEICLAAVYLHDVRKISPQETVVFCPTDFFTENTYFHEIHTLAEKVQKNDGLLHILGVLPTYPSEKYSYILPKNKEKCSQISCYFEKPEEKQAFCLIGSGALWDSGVYAASLEYFLKKAHQAIAFEDYEEFYAKFQDLQPKSFENEIDSKESCFVVRYEGEWKKLGTWNTLTESMEDSSVGNVILDDTCGNVHIVNELDVPVLCMGLSDIVVSASAQGILVSDKKTSSYMAPYTERIHQRIMYAEKSWGSYRVLDVEEESMTIKVVLLPGHGMNYHSHERRDEVWNIIGGTGRIIVDGMEQPVKAGDVITMQAGCRHTILAETELHVIEVQLGREISADDKKKYHLESETFFT